MPLAAAFWLGLALGAPGTFACAAWLAAALACGALAARAPRRTGALFAFLAALAAGAAAGGAARARTAAQHAAFGAVERTVRLRAVLVEPARREAGVPQAAARVVAASPPLPAGVCVRLRLPETCEADWGDTVSALCRLAPFDGPRNPGGFDARAAADAAGIVAHGRAFTASVSPSRAARDLPVRAAMRLRRAMEAELARTLSPRARELAAPLLFGDRSAMTPETDAQLRGSGLVHLLALSGLHVVWLAAVVRGLAAFARRGVRARAAAGAACALGYLLLAGPIPSLVRAAAGECASALARLTGRALDPLQSLALGTLALLAARPAWAGDLGFQLACAATFGLVTLAPAFAAPFARAPVVRGLALPLATTLAAQLAAMPVLLARLHALSWTGLASNLVAVPVAELLLAGAWTGGVAGACVPGAGALALHACEPLAWALDAVAGAASAWPGALLAAGADPSPPVLVGAGVLLLAVGLSPPRTLRARQRGRPPAREVSAALGAVLAACGLLAAATARPLCPPPGRWWLVAIDVGQGDALALAFPDGWWLVDTGARSATWDAGEGAVLPFLRWAGVRHLERLVLTHDDGDHVGGAPAVARAMRPAAVLCSRPLPGVPGPAAHFRAVPLARGEVLRARPRVRVLWPPGPRAADEPVASRGNNGAALVLEVGEGAARALLDADADSLVEARLEAAAGAGVLKAGHHGAASSSGAAWLRRLAPRRVLLSVGRHNRYGHPDPRALARFAAAGARVDRTDDDGAIWYEFSDAGVRRIDWRRGPPGRAIPLAPAPPPGASR